MEEILRLLVVGLTPAGLVILLLLLVPEKIEKWSALLWRALNTLGGVFRSAHKRYVKHDIQGRVNDFSKQLRKEVPGLSRERLAIEWIDASATRANFFANDRLVLRLRREDPEDHNFIHGAYLFVSGALLRKPKRYLSPSQRDAIDLFVCTKLLKSEKPALVDVFLEEYLHPMTEDPKSKVSTLLDDYAVIDGGGYFFPVFVQELDYLGDKVFGRRRDDLVRAEVSGLIEFLKPVATRKIGEVGDLNYSGTYCRFGIVIIGKPWKLKSSIDPWVRYIERSLISKGVETIYLLARHKNRRAVDEVVDSIGSNYEAVRRAHFTGRLRYDDRTEVAQQYLVVVRRRGVELLQPSS